MAKRKKNKARQDDRAAMLAEIVSILTCPVETATNLVASCDAMLEDMAGTYSFARLAAATWGTTDGSPTVIEAIARDVLAEIERHGRAIEALVERIEPLLEDDEEHSDLDPNAVLARIEPILREEPGEVVPAG